MLDWYQIYDDEHNTMERIRSAQPYERYEATDMPLHPQPTIFNNGAAITKYRHEVVTGCSCPRRSIHLTNDDA